MRNEEEELKEKIIADVKQCIVDGRDKEECLNDATKKHNLTDNERNIIQKELDEENTVSKEHIEKEY